MDFLYFIEDAFMINHRIFVIFAAILRVYADTCKDGETMCLNNILRICSSDGYWLEAECPSGYQCNKNKDAISCSRKGQKHNKPDTSSKNKQRKTSDGEDTDESDSIEIEPSMSKDLKTAKSRNRTRTVTVTKKRKKKAKKRSTNDENAGPEAKKPKEFQFEFTSPGQPGTNPTVYSIVFQRLPNSDNIFQQAPFGQQNQGVSGDVNKNQGKGITMGQGESPTISAPSPGMPSVGAPLPGIPSASTQPAGMPPAGAQPTGTPSAGTPSAGDSSAAGAPSPGAPSPSTPPSAGMPSAGSQPSGSPPSAGDASAASTPSPSATPSASAPPSSAPSASAPPSSTPPSAGDASSGKPSEPSSSAPSSTPSSASSGTDSKSKDSASSGGKDSSSSSGGGGQIITAEKLNAAMKASGFSPNSKYVEALVKGVNSKYKDKEMAAMMLAQFAHESGGFAHLEEIACKSGCAGQYGKGAPGKSYHGRGFIQLSWPDNYKKASQALGMGDKLYINPEQVSSDVDIAVKTSFWFWDTNVSKAPGVSEKKFGATTKAINGALECKGSNVDKSKKRYAIYKNVAKEMGITKLASESGCY